MVLGSLYITMKVIGVDFVYEEYIRKRIDSLRESNKLSERQMSLDLGRNTSYINGIHNGKSLPSMGEFLYICEYFGITPLDFFNGEPEFSPTITTARTEISKLDDETVAMLLPLIKKLRSEESECKLLKEQ